LNKHFDCSPSFSIKFELGDRFYKIGYFL